jgi:hypothetical protein
LIGNYKDKELEEKPSFSMPRASKKIENVREKKKLDKFFKNRSKEMGKLTSTTFPDSSQK